MKFLIKNYHFFLLIAILLIVFWIWWLPGVRVSSDFTYVSDLWIKEQFNLPYTWNERGAEGLGEYSNFTLWSYPSTFSTGFFTIFGANFEILERVLILIYILVGALSIWVFLKDSIRSSYARFCAGLVYLLSTYPLVLIDGGQVSIALVYALFPVAFYKFEKAVNANLKEKIISALIVSVMGFYDIRFVLILFLLLFLRFSFLIVTEGKENTKKLLKVWIFSGFLTGFVIFLLNLYWLIPEIIYPLDKQIYASFTRISGISLFNIGHVILLISPQWFKNQFGVISPLRYEFFIIPLLAFSAPLIIKRSKAVAFWLLVFCLSVFLTKGLSGPLGIIYLWLYEKIPGFSLFRDSTKFFVLVCLSYTFLIAKILDIFFEKIRRLKFIAGVSTGIFAFYILFLIRPVLLNQMTGTFSFPGLEREYATLSQFLKKQTDFSRIFLIPSTTPLTYSDPNHPVVEALRIYNRTPFVQGVKGSYEIFNFLREAQYTGEIFDVAGIKYILYPFIDSSKTNYSQDDVKYYYTFLNQLSHLPWVKGLVPESTIPLLETKNHQDKFFITNNTFLVFGSTDILNESTKSANLALSKNALIFEDQYPQTSKLIDSMPESKIILYKKTETDLMAAFFKPENMYFPAEFLSSSRDSGGFWMKNDSDYLSLRDFLNTKYQIDTKDFSSGKGWAIGEGDSALKIKTKQINKDIVLMARVFESSRGGTLNFLQDGNSIGQINTVSKEDNLRWFEVGILKNNSPLIIRTSGGINIINAISFITKKELDENKQRVFQLKDRIVQYNDVNIKAASFSAEISYKKINPTKYELKVTGFKSPQTVIFSTTYNSLWKTGPNYAFPAYGFLNGFNIDHNGIYFIEFEPQGYIYPGLIISLTTLLFIIFLIKMKK